MKISTALPLIAAVLLVSGVGRGAPSAEKAQSGDKREKQARKSVRRALEFLASKQLDSGAFGREHVRIARTSLCGLAFLKIGVLPGEGKHGPALRKSIDYIVSQSQPNGLLASKSYARMYEHAFATLFLAETVAATGEKELRPVVSKAVALIEKAQARSGGWRYDPTPKDADVTVTACQVLALTAARRAGFKVDSRTLDRAVEFVYSCRSVDGGFVYQPGGTVTRFPRTAAALAALIVSKKVDDETLKSGIAYLRRFTSREPDGARIRYYHFGNFFACFVMRQDEKKDRIAWSNRIVDEMLSAQRDDGSFPESSVKAGVEYATAMTCLILRSLRQESK